MAIVGVLLINMLIAMMGNTYTKIAETKNEWQRQWARIVLVVERGVPPHDRLKNFNQYSKFMVDGRPALILRLNMTVRLFFVVCANLSFQFFFIGRREGRNEGHFGDETSS
jgi:hypothetical protein